MNKYLILIVVATMGVWIIQPAVAENCQFHKIKFLVNTFEDLDEPLPGFEFCGIGRVVGTIRGKITSCLNFSDVVGGDELWGDDDDRFSAIKFFNLFETKHGAFQVNERSMIDFANNIQSSISEIIDSGGTGVYEGATGVLTMGPKWPNRLDIQLFMGEICTP